MTLDPNDILKASILIADDQMSNVHLLQQLLIEAGYLNVSSTINPRDVCTLHRKYSFDLILLRQGFHQQAV